MVTVWVILVNPTIRDSAGTMCPKTSALNSPFRFCWIIWPRPWESQTRPSFQILTVSFPNQTSLVLAPDAQINAWFFRFVPYEVRPALLQSVNRDKFLKQDSFLFTATNCAACHDCKIMTGTIPDRNITVLTMNHTVPQQKPKMQSNNRWSTL